MGKAVVFHDHRGSWRFTGATNNLKISLFIGLRQYMFRSYRKLSLIIPSPPTKLEALQPVNNNKKYIRLQAPL